MSDPLLNNPFGILTFIAAPAILTNASSVNAMATSNRLARTIERARMLSGQLESYAAGDERAELGTTLLGFAQRRILLLVRALNAFYFSIGCFAAAALISLVGAIFFATEHAWLTGATLVASFVVGVGGVGGLMYGSGLLVVETRTALRALRTETRRMVDRFGTPSS